MKKIYFAMVFIALTLASYADEVVGHYSMSYFGKENLKIKANKPEDNAFTLYIQIAGEYEDDEVYMSVRSQYLDSFRNSLIIIRDKYVEWSKVAVDNKITNMSKEFPCQLSNISYAWYSSQWWFSYTTNITPLFIVMEDGQKIALAYKEVVSRNNKYVDQTTYLVFKTVAEIEALIKATDPTVVYEYYKKQSSKQDLFQ
jgi:hypothetical protein